MSLHRADKAVLRLAIGLGFAVLIAYGLALPAPFIVCLLTVVMLCKPGPPIPLLKGVVIVGVVAALLVAGVLMVPLLENYAVAGVILTGVILYAVFFAGARKASPLTFILIIAVTIIPAVGVADQALVTALSEAFAVGLGIGVLVGGFSHALFPDVPAAANIAPAPASVSTGSSKVAGHKGHVGRDARICADADEPGVLSANHHEIGDARPASHRHQRRLGRARARGIYIDGSMDGGVGLGRPFAAAEPVDADVMDGGCGALGWSQTIRSHGARPSLHRSGATP